MSIDISWMQVERLEGSFEEAIEFKPTQLNGVESLESINGSYWSTEYIVWNHFTDSKLHKVQQAFKIFNLHKNLTIPNEAIQ